MEIAHVLKTLWRLKLLVVLGAVLATTAAYATVYKFTLPPTFESRSIEYGAASTQILVDTGSSPLVDVGQDVSPLATRAQVYAQLVASEPVKRAIARKAGLEPEALLISSRTTETGTRSAAESVSEQRSNELRDELKVRRLLFSADEGLPVVSVLAEGGTAEDAIRLADAGAEGLIEYVSSLDSLRTSAASRVTLTQLGEAQGGLVNQGASKAVAMMAFIGVFTVWCIALVLLANLVEALRAPAPRSRRARMSAADAVLLVGPQRAGEADGGQQASGKRGANAA